MISYREITFPDRDEDLRDVHRFVRSTWISSYKNARSAGIISSEDWADVMHLTLGKLLRRSGVRTILAHDPPRQFYGFIAGEPGRATPVVHYVYVKDAYRSEVELDGSRSGPRIGRGLFAALGIDPAAPFIYTCETVICVRLADKIPYARFKPGAARYSNYHEHQEQRRP